MCDDHSRNISVCGVWKVRIGIQVSRRGNFTHTHTHIYIYRYSILIFSEVKKCEKEEDRKEIMNLINHSSHNLNLPNISKCKYKPSWSFVSFRRISISCDTFPWIKKWESPKESSPRQPTSKRKFSFKFSNNSKKSWIKFQIFPSNDNALHKL